MKKIFLLIFLVIASNVWGQSGSKIPMLITVSPKGCVKYLDSLLAIKGSLNKIDSSTDNAGNLILSVGFPFEEREFYRCAATSLLFFGDPQKEICMTQILSGPIKYGYDNLQLVKQKFKQSFDELGVWEMDYIKGMIIKATYKVEGEGFILTYELVEK